MAVNDSMSVSPLQGQDEALSSTGPAEAIRSWTPHAVCDDLPDDRESAKLLAKLEDAIDRMILLGGEALSLELILVAAAEW